MILKHAKIIVQKAEYVEAQRVIAEAETEETNQLIADANNIATEPETQVEVPQPIEENPTENEAPVEETEDSNE
ncbi:hypothetical protein LCGC14_0359910 [marine sediment metagenome]|uniref:Uncharacterized protein n=1 Tax=marine sediment metagenome TaxID=412755 RepID=A0A0F9TR66_9ZZZZ